jgi:hypothetical protein
MNAMVRDIGFISRLHINCNVMLNACVLHIY